MSRSRKDAEQELQRLKLMLRAMQDQKDDAAKKIHDRVAEIEKELGGLPDAPGGKKSSPNMLLFATLVLLIGLLAFAAMYFVIRISQN
jgi:hypothetical protein